MTIAEKKKFCRKHGLIYDRQLDKAGKSYCRKDRRGRKKKKTKKESDIAKDPTSDKESAEVGTGDIAKDPTSADKSVSVSVSVSEGEGEGEGEGESEGVSEGVDVDVSEGVDVDVSGGESVSGGVSGGVSEGVSGGEECNKKGDGSDINCSLGKICNLDNKKCEKLEDNMEIHNINGANVIGDELIVKKIKELIEERNEFNMNRENDYDIKKCFGLLVEDSDSE